MLFGAISKNVIKSWKWMRIFDEIIYQQ